jgi:two-component system chemotaxis response regulator CheB
MNTTASSLAKGAAPDAGAETYRILVVDDSAVIRGLIARACESNPSIKVIATAGNGDLAVKAFQGTPVDVIILDIEMPVMDGLAAIPLLKAVDPAVQIIMASTLTQKNAEISMKAMALGATDYIPKPTSSGEMSVSADFSRELIEKILTLGALARRKGVRRPVGGTKPAATPSLPKKVTLRTTPVVKPDVIAIGSSTGGPQALFEVIKTMSSGLTQPVVITQHMPPNFTTILAEHIARQCKVPCAEAKDGELLKPGHYYVAPGDFHMLINKKSEGAAVKLAKDPPENFCRPAVDPMLRSLVEVFGKRVLTVILTGMGSDGCKGSEVVVNAGGSVIAQDELSSVVWGMPGAVAVAGLCTAVLPLQEIGSIVRQYASRPGI